MSWAAGQRTARCSRARSSSRLLPLAVLAAWLATAPAAAAVTIVIDPGHDRYANPGYEPIGPGSSTYKIKDGGGTPGVVTGQSEASVNMRIAWRLRALLRQARRHPVGDDPHPHLLHQHGEHRPGADRQPGPGHALRAHPRRRVDRPRTRGTSMVYPAWHRGWTDDIYGRSRQAARLVQRSLVRALDWPDRGLVARGDLTGFNWSNRPAILAEVGFLTNAREDRALATFRKVNKAAWGLRNGVMAYLHARGLR